VLARPALKKYRYFKNAKNMKYSRVHTVKPNVSRDVWDGADIRRTEAQHGRPCTNNHLPFFWFAVVVDTDKNQEYISAQLVDRRAIVSARIGFLKAAENEKPWVVDSTCEQTQTEVRWMTRKIKSFPPQQIVDHSHAGDLLLDHERERILVWERNSKTEKGRKCFMQCIAPIKIWVLWFYWRLLHFVDKKTDFTKANFYRGQNHA
jgi:hypothetical protein